MRSSWGLEHVHENVYIYIYRRRCYAASKQHIVSQRREGLLSCSNFAQPVQYTYIPCLLHRWTTFRFRVSVYRTRSTNDPGQLLFKYSTVQRKTCMGCPKKSFELYQRLVLGHWKGIISSLLRNSTPQAFLFHPHFTTGISSY